MRLFGRKSKKQKVNGYEEAYDLINDVLNHQEKAKDRRVYRLYNNVYLPADVDFDEFVSEFVCLVESKGGMCPGSFRDITDEV